MGKLTSKQVNELANNFLALAQSLGDYRYKNFNSLTELQNKKLRESHKRTLDYSDDLYTLSATLVMNDAEESLAAIHKITKKIKKTYKSIDNVQNIINIATGVVTLGASIFSLNPQAIIDAFGNLKKAVEQV
ncbi:hypothetical protein [Tenacibaculum agarivorans]|uniref:hypothetical protein n=1 Tax=Tenacibaculum agarivorans TaxID=1908389 RepID=UPI00094BB053|nr:hypothetical protein [Tenacibaculum agarivorans]